MHPVAASHQESTHTRGGWLRRLLGALLPATTRTERHDPRRADPAHEDLRPPGELPAPITQDSGPEVEPCVGEQPADDEVVLQQVMRIRDAAGRESIYATLRAEFQPGQRYASLQVAFSPAFDELPTIEAELIEGPDAQVTLQQAMHHGAHLEVRLALPPESATHCTVELAAYLPTGAEPPTSE